MSRKLIVSKFGGTSMGSFEAMLRSAQISKDMDSFLIAVSATSGTTDELIELAHLASKAQMDEAKLAIKNIEARHRKILSDAGNQAQTLQILEGFFTELDLLVQNIALLRELTPRAHDHILSLGERMSSLIFKDVVASIISDKEVRLLDARSIIRTDSHFGKASPLIEDIARNAKEKLDIKDNIVYVTQGFIGADREGNTTVLGRGGSDFSAALFAESIGAHVLQIWTDVSGIASTDPRIVPNARVIPELSYSEAAEMAQYGAKILHPATIAPAVRKEIPVFVGSSINPLEGGTWIRKAVNEKPTVRAITKRSKQALVTVTTPQMFNAFGFMSEIFGIFAKHRISVDCVTTSEIAVAITVDMNTLTHKKLIEDLREVAKVEIDEGYELISLIGNDLHTRPSIAKNIFSTIADTNIRMMSLGASAYNFNFLVKEADSNSVMTKLHKTLIEGA